MSEHILTRDLAERFAAIALGHVTREYHNKLDHVLNEACDARTPRDLHPIFFGSFDWHSCVHGYWLLAHLRRRFPDMARAADIAGSFDLAFTADNVAGELAYQSRPLSGGFERPYGWAWLLKLAAELRHDPAAVPWAIALAPLAEAFVLRFHAFLPKLTYPIRTGSHGSSAFALLLAAAYARTVQDGALLQLLAARARDWFGDDKDAGGWEPGGDDFLSPAWTEAACMQALLPPQDFRAWFGAFLPGLADSLPRAIFEPAMVSDRSDGKIAHLDGLNLSRAWCMRLLAGAVEDELCETLLRTTASRHLEAALPHVAGDYMGEHWLATYAVLAMGSCA